MKRRIFSPREIILPKAKLARSAISWGKFSMPILLWACFFVFSVSINNVAAAELPKITAGNTSFAYSNWKSSFTWKHTVVGNDPVLVVSLHGDGNYLNANSVTYNGQVMTLAANRVNDRAYNNIAVYIYYLANPPQGDHNITVNISWALPFAASAITFYNCDMADPVGLTNTFLDTASPMTHSVATAKANMMLVDAVTYNLSESLSLTSGQGQTGYFIQHQNGQWYGQTNSLYAGESYKLAEQVGTSTMSWATNGGGTSVQAIIGLNPKYQEVAKEPVIIVPGIMGSWNVSGRWQIDPIFHTYDNLMEALIAAGYKENSLNEAKPTLFTFPYDWRTDNNLTAGLLKDKINSVKAITGASKVDIIAHSMGGLVARSYIEGSGYQSDIDQIVFLGTPHQGSPESYLKYEGAEFVEKWDWFKKYLFQIEAATQGYLDLTDYIRAKVPTVEQLLPVYNYLKDKQPDNSYQLRTYPLNYPQNTYLENLNSQANINLLKQKIKITNIVGDLGQSSTLNYLRVVADPDITDNKWQSGYPENLTENLNSLEKGNGDSTVPLSSANSLSGVEIIKTGISDHENLPTVMQKEIVKTLTGKMPTDYFNSKITATIKRWAFFRVYSPVDFAVVAPDGRRVGKNFASSTEINQIPDAFYSGFGGHEEFVLIPNPQDGEYKVEVRGVNNGGQYTLASSLIDGNNEIGREFSGNIAPGQEREFNITYSAASENPISDLEPIDTVPPVVMINKPLDGDEYPYRDNLVIDYTVTDDFSGIASTTIILDGQEITATTIKLSDYSLGQHNLVIRAIDNAGNQTRVQVNFTIIDNVPPVVAVSKPTAGEKYLHSDNLFINYSATDEFAGIATTTMAIDGQAVVTTAIDLFDYALGQHSLVISAFDNAGNRAQQQINFEIISNIDSTISDIKEIHNRGWLKKGLYRALLENAFKLLKIETKYFEREQELTEKMIKKTGQDSKLNAKQKQKLIEQYIKKLAELKKNRAKAISHSLDAIVVLLNNAKKQNKINQAGYDIILNDINYLRINL
ncbi:MAG: hypothetical protein Q8O59_02740 [bacterium]|nr:hypothetical protein [bacterium]